MSTSEFARATDFTIESIKVDGKEIGSIVFSIEIYENLFSYAVSGAVLVVETVSNQFLKDNKIEGNETIEISLSCAEDHQLAFKGYINKIADLTVSTNGVTSYALEFVSEFIRQNEQTSVTKKFNLKPEQIVDIALDRLNKDAQYPLEKSIFEGDGIPMSFVASGWSPKRLIHYVLTHGVPSRYTGSSTYSSGASKNSVHQSIGSGTGGFLFWETLEGFRYGSSMNILNGEVGQVVEKSLNYQLANRMETVEQTRDYILSYNNLQLNDTQTQQLAGAFHSQMIGFNADTGEYVTQSWQSDLATDKQKATSKKATRTFTKLMSNERFSNSCTKTPDNTHDQCLINLQQSTGILNNFHDNVCQLSMPVRPDLHVGDTIDLQIYKVSQKSESEKDEKLSGSWIISAIGHHAQIESSGAYSRLTCIRSINQIDEAEASKPVGN
jgi:hypothetical protein